MRRPSRLLTSSLVSTWMVELSALTFRCLEVPEVATVVVVAAEVAVVVDLVIEVVEAVASVAAEALAATAVAEAEEVALAAAASVEALAAVAVPLLSTTLAARCSEQTNETFTLGVKVKTLYDFTSLLINERI